MSRRLADNIVFNEENGQLKRIIEEPVLSVYNTITLTGEEYWFFKILVDARGATVPYEEHRAKINGHKHEGKNYNVSERGLTKLKGEIQAETQILFPQGEYREIVKAVKNKGYRIDYLFHCDDMGRMTEEKDPDSLPMLPSKIEPFGRPGRNAFFTGRDSLLEKLRSNFENGSKVQILNGMGGMGKTALALQYSYIYENEYDLIHFVDARSPETIEESYRTFITLYGDASPVQGRDALLEQYKAFIGKKSRWLIVYDNCDFYGPEEIKELKDRCMPQSDGHIIITSRDLSDLDVGGAKTLDVDRFSEDEAVSFIMLRTGAPDDDKSRADAKMLAKRLGYFPLALEIASAYIKATFRCTVEKYLRLLEENIDILEDTDNEKTLKQIMELTLESIGSNEKDEDIGQAIRELLYVSAFSFPDGIDLSLFGPELSERANYHLVQHLYGWCNSERRRDKLATVGIKYALFKANGDYLSVHPLQQEITRKQLIKDTKPQNYGELMYDLCDAELEKMGDDWERRWSSSAMRNKVYCLMVSHDFFDFEIDDTPVGYYRDASYLYSVMDAYSAKIYDKNDFMNTVRRTLDKYPPEEQNFFTLRSLAEITSHCCNYANLHEFSDAFVGEIYERTCDIIELMADRFEKEEINAENLDLLLDAVSDVLLVFTYSFNMYDFAMTGLDALCKYDSLYGIGKYIKDHTDINSNLDNRFISLIDFMNNLLLAFLWFRESSGSINKEFLFPSDQMEVLKRYVFDCIDTERNAENTDVLDEGMEHFTELIEALKTNDKEVLRKRNITSVKEWELWKYVR